MARASQAQESKTEAEASEAGFVKSWLEAIEQADKDEEDWRKKAEEAVEIFRGKSGRKTTRFNIFFANVETICPSVYNSTPSPDVRRRYNDEDPVGKDVAELVERALSYSVDTYDFDATMKAIVRDGEVVGRGIPRVRYKPTFASEPVLGSDGLPVIGEDGKPVTEDRVVDEEVTSDYVPWKQFRRGPAFLWSQLPWVAFGDYLSKEDVVKLVGEELAKELPFNYVAGPKGEFKKTDAKESSIFKRMFVWQVWDRETRRVIYICPDYAKKALRVIEDPLGLEGFFPAPRPYQPVTVTDSLVPTIPYSIYEDLVIELNELTGRITKLIKQCKPRGLGVGNANDLAAVAEADDGEIKPVQMTEALIHGGGLEKMISWFPLDPTVKALVQLVAQREQVKQIIYEVTGIADILRGSTAPSETATAQQLKAQWGSIRIQDRQAEVQRVARDLFRLKAEIIATKFSPEKLGAMTGMEVTPEMMQVLRDDLSRKYRIDIETDSTIRGDAARNQEAMASFISGTAEYAAAVTPITQSAPILAAPFIEIYTSFARQFNLGKQAEDALDMLAQKARESAKQAEQPPPPSPEQVDMDERREMEKMKMEADIRDQDERRQMENNKMITDALAAGVTPETLAAANLMTSSVEARIDALSQAILQMGEMLAAVAQQVSAPRKTLLIKGPDGRTIGAESSLVEEAPQPTAQGPSTLQ